VLEPFAGDGAIPKFLSQLEFACFDLEPRDERIARKDTLEDFPLGFSAVITNPPYRRDPKNANLWRLALEKCLANASFVAVVVPQSFLASAHLYGRLEAVILATHRSTEGRIPVCLALFGPQPVPDFELWLDTGRLVGQWMALLSRLPSSHGVGRVRFAPDGEVGLVAVDSYRGNRIRFCRGDEISDGVTEQSRTIARFHIDVAGEDLQLDALVSKANEILENLRSSSADSLLTPFFEHGKNGKVRRRLPFRLARRILAKALRFVEANSSSPRPPGVRSRTQKTIQPHAFPRASGSEEQTPYSAAG
jgi:hypothetical protein